MATSFGIVEEKTFEAHFFLEKLRDTRVQTSDARFFFSAFVSACRSITFALQVSMHGIPNFSYWYQRVQTQLKLDPLAAYFVEVRNNSIHKGLNPLNTVSIEHLRQYLTVQLSGDFQSDVIVIPTQWEDGSTMLAEATVASTEYFKSLVSIIYQCYDHFKTVVDPRWYFTCENFRSMGKTFEDAVVELGFPSTWASHAPEGDHRWRVLRRMQPPCQLNQLFRLYLGVIISDPDDSQD